MQSPVYIALSRQAGLRRELTVIANNVANSSSNGFRGERTLFQEYLARTGTPGRRENVSLTQDIGLIRDTREGPLVQTGNDTDVSVRGRGFLVVGTPGQEIYQRTGSFTLNGQGQIQNAEGYPLLGEAGPITLPAGYRQFKVTGDGTVTAIGENGQTQAIGRLRVVDFENQQVLQKTGINSYSTDQPAQAVAQPELVQGAVEGANVQPVLEITRMISLERDYQALSRFMESENDRQRNAIQKIV